MGCPLSTPLAKASVAPLYVYESRPPPPPVKEQLQQELRPQQKRRRQSQAQPTKEPKVAKQKSLEESRKSSVDSGMG